jgi:hypothetical protein
MLNQKKGVHNMGISDGVEPKTVATTEVKVDDNKPSKGGSDLTLDKK